MSHAYKRICLSQLQKKFPLGVSMERLMAYCLFVRAVYKFLFIFLLFSTCAFIFICVIVLDIDVFQILFESA